MIKKRKTTKHYNWLAAMGLHESFRIIGADEEGSLIIGYGTWARFRKNRQDWHL